jgi:hypothetical protein
MTVTSTETIPTLRGKDIAAVVRRQFRRDYPEVKVSVRSADQTINISWSDGPASAGMAANFWWAKGASFDGMTDCLSIRPPVLISEIEDAQTRAELLKLTVGAARFSTYNHFVFANRDYTLAAWDLVAAEIKKQHGIEMDRHPSGAVADTINGGSYPDAPAVLTKGDRYFGSNAGYFGGAAHIWLDHTDIPTATS